MYTWCTRYAAKPYKTLLSSPIHHGGYGQTLLWGIDHELLLNNN